MALQKNNNNNNNMVLYHRLSVCSCRHTSTVGRRAIPVTYRCVHLERFTFIRYLLTTVAAYS